MPQNTTKTTCTWIDDDASLAQACAALRKEPVIAIDTECVRETTYYPIAALAQIASQHYMLLIDLAAIKDFSPLCSVLSDTSIIKIIHSMQQDHEILKRLGCRVEMPVFDTQIAVAFLGQERQLGYKDLIQRYLGIDLEKSCTRSDWLQRPLTDEQKEYALEDVLYLIEAYELLDKQLQEQGKQDWFTDENERLLQLDQEALDTKITYLYERIRGKGKIKCQSQKDKLLALIKWRELSARSADVPRKWFLHDKNLVAMACLEPLSEKAIAPLIKKLPEKLRAQYRQELLSLLNNIDENSDPVKSYSLNKQQQKRVEEVAAQITKLSAQHGIDSTLIASQKEISQWVGAGELEATSLLNVGWRKALLEESV